MAWRPRSSWLSTAPAPQASAASRIGAARATTRRDRRITDRTALHRQHDAVVTGIGAAVEAVGMHADGMHGGKPVGAGIADDLVPLHRQLSLDAARDAIRYIDGIAGCREARRAHRLPHGHVEVDSVQEYLENAHGDLGRARRADHDVRALAFVHDARHHGGETRLARSEAPRSSRPRVEHAHAAVVHEAQTLGDHARGHAKRMRHGDAVAFAVDHGDVRGVAARRAARVEARHLRLLPYPDLLGEPPRVRLARELFHRDVDEARVADVAVLVDGGALHRLRNHADVLGRVVLELAQGEALQDVEHLDEHHPAAGRPVARDAVGAVGAPQRPVSYCLPLAQVGRAEEAIVAAHVLHDGVRDLTLVEDLVAVLG